MMNRQIITKVMSDGWTIEEHYDPIEGLKNRYFFDKRRAPSIKMVDKISQQYAAYTLIEKDLRSVIFWLEEIERQAPEQLDRVKNPDKMNLIKGLFVSALTFYEKCFTSCEGRKLKLERKVHVSEEYLNTHDQVIKLRHNYAAHSGAENFEEVRVSLVLHPSKKSDMKPQLYSELKQPDWVAEESLNFKSLAKDLQEKVKKKRSSVGEVVFEKIVKPKGKHYWYNKEKS